MKATPSSETESPSWNHPKNSGIRIREVINRTGTEVFGSSFLVTVPSKLTDKGRLRKQFSTQAEAEEWAESQFTGAKQQGQEYFELDPSERNEAIAALKLVRPHNLSLLKVVEFGLARMRPAGGDQTVEAVVKELIESKERRFSNGQLRDRSLADFRLRASRFSTKHGKTLIKEIDHQQIKSWVFSLNLGVRSNKNYIAVLSEVFRHALQKKYVSTNPLEDLTDIDRKELQGNEGERREPNILSVEKATKLLETACAHPELDLLGAVTLGLFCGIRTQELTKLDWSHVTIDLEKPEKSFVTIPSSIAKKRRIRNVTIPANALEWLALCPRRKGPLTRNDYSSDYRKRFLKLQQLAGFGKIDQEGKWRSTWEENNMRHSFGTYHFALHGNSLETARQLGHTASDHILFEHYRALATKEQAEAFFGLVPSASDSKILHFRKTA